MLGILGWLGRGVSWIMFGIGTKAIIEDTVVPWIDAKTPDYVAVDPASGVEIPRKKFRPAWVLVLLGGVAAWFLKGGRR